MGESELDKRIEEVEKRMYEVVKDTLKLYMDFLRENNCKKCAYREKCSEQMRALESTRLAMHAMLRTISAVAYEEYGIPEGVTDGWMYSYLDTLILRRKLTLVSKFGASDDGDYGLYG